MRPILVGVLQSRTGSPNRFGCGQNISACAVRRCGDFEKEEKFKRMEDQESLPSMQHSKRARYWAGVLN